MNSWYNRITGQQTPTTPINPVRQQAPMNPIQKAQFIMRTLTDPAAFVRQQFPDVPENMLDNPNQVLNYIMQSRGISQQQMQQIMNQFPHP